MAINHYFDTEKRSNALVLAEVSQSQMAVEVHEVTVPADAHALDVLSRRRIGVTEVPFGVSSDVNVPV